MKTVKIHCIKAKAKRLNRPDMIEKYREMAYSWAGDECTLDDTDHAELNAMWENHIKPVQLKICKTCGGL